MLKRRKKLVRPDVQLRVILIATFVAYIALLVQLYLGVLGLSRLAFTAAAGMTAAEAIDRMRSILVNEFFFAAAITIPFAALLGIEYSFRFAGPLIRLKRYFADLRIGRWDQPLRFRQSDLLGDVSASINIGLEQLQERLKAHDELFRDLETFLDEEGNAAAGAGQGRLESLKERVAAERSQHVLRFGSGEPALEPAVAEPARAS